MQITAIEIVIVGIVYTIIILFIQRKLGNMPRMYEIQEKIKSKTDELNKLAKAAEISKEELAAKQKEIMELVSESTKHSMKPALAILPLSIAMYYFILPKAFPMFLSPPYISLVIFHLAHYQFIFIAVTLVLSLITTSIFARIEKKKLAARQNMEAKAQ